MLVSKAVIDILLQLSQVIAWIEDNHFGVMQLDSYDWIDKFDW